jgi:hypothetical protein
MLENKNSLLCTSNFCQASSVFMVFDFQSLASRQPLFSVGIALSVQLCFPVAFRLTAFAS